MQKITTEHKVYSAEFAHFEYDRKKAAEASGKDLSPSFELPQDLLDRVATHIRSMKYHQINLG